MEESLWSLDYQSCFERHSSDVDAGCDFYGVHSGIPVIRAGSLYCPGANGHQWDYRAASRRIRRDIIVEVLKDENV